MIVSVRERRYLSNHIFRCGNVYYSKNTISILFHIAVTTLVINHEYWCRRLVRDSGISFPKFRYGYFICIYFIYPYQSAITMPIAVLKFHINSCLFPTKHYVMPIQQALLHPSKHTELSTSKDTVMNTLHTSTICNPCLQTRGDKIYKSVSLIEISSIIVRSSNR
jgi:hypothetical protein